MPLTCSVTAGEWLLFSGLCMLPSVKRGVRVDDFKSLPSLVFKHSLNVLISKLLAGFPGASFLTRSVLK